MALFDVVIDVSDANGTINWPLVAQVGVKVAMIKATEGRTFTATTWHSNQRDASQVGIKVIPYHYMNAGDPAAQAAHFHSVVGLTHGMPYAVDWEGHRTATAQDVEQMGQALAQIAGRNPLGYWGIPGSTPETPTAVMNNWDRWVPRYPISGLANFAQMPAAHNSPGVPFLFWQYTSEGQVLGINGDVDRSVASFNNLNDLLQW